MSSDTQLNLTQDKPHGHEVYSKLTLSIYDMLVLRFSNTFIWRCPAKVLLNHYQQHMSAKQHLDVGVGTGYFLKRAKQTSQLKRLGLLDLNDNCLRLVEKKFEYLKPECYQHDLLTPFTKSVNSFDSIALNYVLHCLPGNLAEKCQLFDNLAPFFKPGTTIFGATLLAEGVSVSKPAQRLMALYNSKGIFSNSEDSLSDLSQQLQQRFEKVEITIQGSVALFSAKAR